jgi:steroid delta-isomerase-like uncharacterized protein
LRDCKPKATRATNHRGTLESEDPWVDWYPLCGELYHPHAGRVVQGPSGATQLYTAYTTAFPDTHYTVEDVVAEGERVVIRFTFSGTHRGDIRGIAGTGKSVAVAGMVLFRFADGQVIEQRGVWDSLSAMQQLGVVQLGVVQGAG